MRKKLLEQLIKQLLKDAKENIWLAKHGSDITSMADDGMAGAIGGEQRRIAKKLQEIIGEKK